MEIIKKILLHLSKQTLAGLVIVFGIYIVRDKVNDVSTTLNNINANQIEAITQIRSINEVQKSLHDSTQKNFNMTFRKLDRYDKKFDAIERSNKTLQNEFLRIDAGRVDNIIVIPMLKPRSAEVSANCLPSAQTDDVKKNGSLTLK